ncbi:hypothetical protein B0H16DRAFT_1814731 [Mycena metata]|uniref:Uncharacterized protein n=1 Tax=Mycena metata TaxID=1033252 RepID=A0AAD7MDF4_9AGAR|nr:hypothetical protein B0H16DRAFT_1814731 [Mycena metata]
MSTKQVAPAGHPPPPVGAIENGHPTPKYVLAWVCNPTVFFKNLGGGELGIVHDCNFSDAVSKNWRTQPKFGFGLRPLPYPGPDGNLYLISMFNKPDADHIKRVHNLAQDPLIESARVSMGVDKDESLEQTLQWYRWPLNWLQAEAVLARQESDSNGNELEGNQSEEDSELKSNA